MQFKRFKILFLTLGILLAMPSYADLNNSEEICLAVEEVQDKYGQLRSMSLAVRGTLPTAAEIDALSTLEEIPQEWLDAWFTTDEYAAQAKRFFDSLLWPNITNNLLFNTNTQINGDPIWRRGSFPRAYRTDYVSCDNVPAEFDEVTGEILTHDVNGSQVEGYRMISPYWAPDTQVKVCFFDAQEDLISPSGNRCDTEQGTGDAGCGCGPNLNWCASGVNNRIITESLALDLQKRIFTMIKNDEPLTSLFNSSRAFVNGPLVHYYKHLSEVSSRIPLSPLPFSEVDLPDLDFTQVDTWIEIELPSYHAGILTSPLFLIRFQTNRARANNFYNSFMCQPFQPPPGGIPNVTGGAEIEPDLQIRHGCKYCHALLEPAAAYWGRWSEGGAGYLSPTNFPMIRDDCLRCAQTGAGCSQECRQQYIVNTSHDNQLPYLGLLNAYMFRRTEHESHVENGPELLALRAVVDNRFPRCMARRVASHLLGREVHAAEDIWVEAIAHEFVQSGYKFKALTKAVLQSETYRRLK